jgi:transcriptional regulator with XRE-family HTH domain
MRKAQDLPVLRAAAAEIKARRASLKISQEELAHRAELHRSFVARLEVAQTQPSLAILFRLAEALGVDIVDLTGAIATLYRKEQRQARRPSR